MGFLKETVPKLTDIKIHRNLVFWGLVAIFILAAFLRAAYFCEVHNSPQLLFISQNEVF